MDPQSQTNPDPATNLNPDGTISQPQADLQNVNPEVNQVPAVDPVAQPVEQPIAQPEIPSQEAPAGAPIDQVPTNEVVAQQPVEPAQVQQPPTAQVVEESSVPASPADWVGSQPSSAPVQPEMIQSEPVAVPESQPVVTPEQVVKEQQPVVVQQTEAVQVAQAPEVPNNLNQVVQGASQAQSTQEVADEAVTSGTDSAEQSSEPEMPVAQNDQELLAQMTTAPGKKVKPLKKSGRGGRSIWKIFGILFICVLVCGGTIAAALLLGLKLVYDEYPAMQDTALAACTNAKLNPNAIGGSAGGFVAFPEEFSCEDLKTDGIVELVTAGQLISVSTVNGDTTGQLSFDNGEQNITISMAKQGDIWSLSSIDLTQDVKAEE